MSRGRDLSKSNMDNQFTPPPEPKDPAHPSTPEPSLHTQDNQPPSADPIQSKAEKIKRPKKPISYRARGFLSLFQLVAGALVLAFIINHIVFQSYEVFGQSMTPTLHEGDRLIISKLGKSWSSLLGRDYLPKRGEIVVFHNPHEEETQLVKRIVGLPGDRVVVAGGNISVINDEYPLGFNFDDEFDLSLSPTVGNVDMVVPDGEVFVVGDNRVAGGSLDSRNDLGTVPINQMVGDLVIRIFPLNQASWY